MIRPTSAFTNAESIGSPTSVSPPNRLGPISRLWLLVWCGLVAGLLEVGALELRKQVFDPDQFTKMSHHFIWLIPLVNLCLFLTLGSVGWGLIRPWPRSGRWLWSRVLCAMTVLPALLVAFPRIYGLAWLVVALGTAARLVPLFEERSARIERFIRVSLPVLVAVVAILAASLWVGEWDRERRENARPVPAGAPNILLIVMDTVAAGHLSLHGYDRATSTTLVELAARGIRFDSARSASSWTLPSHATMFTGRWLHELAVGWLTPLGKTHPALAEFLSERGYATAGFVANTAYCGRESGLARGFTHYQDFIFPELTVLKTSVLVSRALEVYQAFVYFTEDWLESAGLLPFVERLWRALDTDRKGARSVNHELLDWLSQRTRPERPFFAFLNYYDSHYPYQLPPGRLHRFGVEPTDNFHRVLIQHWWELDKTTVSPEGVAFAMAAYDDCVADLDEQLGILVDELDRRGLLKQTWLFITSDHGESFGEHPGIFCHGKSLYESEVHVPLLVIPPHGTAAARVVNDPVSLRDIAATVVDAAGITADVPFPGRSMAHFWNQPSPASPINQTLASPALAEVVPNNPGKRDDWGLPKALSPLGAIKDQEWSYIRQTENFAEELFHLTDDAREQRNLAGDPALAKILEQKRGTLDGLTGGPLAPHRFPP